MKVLILKSCL